MGAEPHNYKHAAEPGQSELRQLAKSRDSNGAPFFLNAVSFSCNSDRIIFWDVETSEKCNEVIEL